MPLCNLIIDSCCDLPMNMVERESVYLLKFPYTIGNGSFVDDLFTSSSAHDFYEGMRNGKEPTTAQLTVPELTKAYQWALDQGKPTVYLSFTSGLSGSYDTAVLVKNQFLEEHPDFELYVVDTRLASIAEGLLVHEALLQQQKGISASDLAKWAEEARNFVDEEFMVEDLEALRRGGRIPSTVAFAGTKLDVKPLLTIAADGTLALAAVARGRKKGIHQLALYYQKHVQEEPQSPYVVIGHADCPKDLQRLKDEITRINDQVLFLECNIGPVIGSHVGPGMLAVVFWGKDKREGLSMADRIANRVKAAR